MLKNKCADSLNSLVFLAMCYSAMLEQRLKTLGPKYKARIEPNDYFINLFLMRNAGADIKITKGLENNFIDAKTPAEIKVKTEIDKFRKIQIEKFTEELKASESRFAAAKEKLLIKKTKRAEKELEVSDRKIQKSKFKIEFFGSEKERASDNRIYPFDFAAVMMETNGQREFTPMRYHLRPRGADESFDRKYPGCYNARLDNIQGFWKKQFGQFHGIAVVKSFFENVKRHDFEHRNLKTGEKEENQIVEFKPKDIDEMLVPCLFDYSGKNGEFISFAMITNDPPPEVVDAGHDRCPIFIKEKYINEWLNPIGKSPEKLLAILNDPEKPFYNVSK